MVTSVQSGHPENVHLEENNPAYTMLAHKNIKIKYQNFNPVVF